LRCIPYDLGAGYNYTTIELIIGAAFVGLAIIGMILICCRAKGKADHIKLVHVYRAHHDKCKKEENYAWKKNQLKPVGIDIPVDLRHIIGESANDVNPHSSLVSQDLEYSNS
jgi:hypothetical protein